MGVASGPRPASGRAASFRATATSRPSIGPPTAEPADAGRCPELDCVRELLAADVIEAAEARSKALGIGADRVLIAAGKLNEETYLRALANSLGVAFETLEAVPRAYCPLSDERLIESAAAGMLPLSIDGELSLVVAPRALAARRIQELIQQSPARAQRFCFTSANRLQSFVLRHAGATIASRATNSLRKKSPTFSAAPPRWRMISPFFVIAMTLAIAFVAAPSIAAGVCEMALAATFIGWLGLRLVGAFIKHADPNTVRSPIDAALPVYSIVAALYREAKSVDGLLRAIERLDYPGIMAQTPQSAL